MDELFTEDSNLNNKVKLMKIEINVNTQETNQEITKYAEGFEKLLKSITIDTGNAIKRIQHAE